MFKNKKEYQNELTTFIKNQNPTLEHVILHESLSITLRNGANTLLNFLFSPENYEKVIDYALFDKTTETEEFGKLSIRQINNNAANILSYPSDKIKNYISKKEENGKPLLLQKLEDFIKDKKLSHDPFYAGHFERIYENILRYDKAFTIFFNDDFVDKLISFLTKNILILPYKELLQILLDDFIEKISDSLVKKILNTMLKYATFFSYVTYCLSSSKNSLLESYKKSIQYFKEMQPNNSHQQAPPIPDFESYDDDKNVKKYKKAAKEKGKKFFPTEFISKNIDEFDFEESQMKSYSFLSSIRIAFINNNHNELLDDERIIEMLLYCAVFSDSESLSSAEAFKILENMYYGVLGESDYNEQPQFYIEPLESDQFYKLIDEYADFISYNNKYLTKQQVNAFPIFWNHKYKNLIDKKPLFINIDHVLNMNKYYIYPEELTPFIAFRPLLLSDPPYSSQLTENYIKIFDFLIRKKEKLIGNEKKEMKEIDEQTQNEIRQIVYIVYEFIQRKFNFYTKNNYCNYYDALDQMVPSFPHTMKEAEDNPPKRSLLNGAIYKVFEIIFNSSFFFINGKASLLLYDIQHDNETNTDVIQKIIEYNRRKPVL